MANLNKSGQLHNFSVQENLSSCFMIEYETSGDSATDEGAFATTTYGIPRAVIVGAEIGGSGNLAITFGDGSTHTIENADAKNIFLKGAILPISIKSWSFSASESAFSLLALY